MTNNYALENMINIMGEQFAGGCMLSFMLVRTIASFQGVSLPRLVPARKIESWLHNQSS